MKTWHEIMMDSSPSFKQCHDDRGGSGCPCNIIDLLMHKTEVINDYISITNQGGGHYWSTPNYEIGFEAGKNYQVIINDEEFSGSTVVDGNTVKLQTNDEKLDIKYNTLTGLYVINYYPVEDIGSNPTVNFEVYEVTYNKIPKECLPE